MNLNKNGVNAAIKAKVLSDAEMRKIGFTDYNEKVWYFSRIIKLPKNRYRNIEISFNVSIDKKYKSQDDLRIDVLDEDFLQPYDYQNMLERNPHFELALIVKEQVEDHMKYLQDNGVLSGHIYGEYI